MNIGYNEYKDSGVPWIGKIPLDWTVLRFKHLAKIKNGKDQKEVLIEDGGFPILGTGGEFGRASNFLYDKPSVLLGRKGTVDKPQYIKEPFWTVDTLFYTEIYSCVEPVFLYYLSTLIPFKSLQESSAVPSMTQEKLHNVLMCLPPLEEQKQILAFLDHKTALIDEIIAKKERLIELLQAKRQATINEVVTGKKVWNAASQTWEAPAKVKNSGVEWLGEIPEEWEVVKLRRIGEFSKGKGITKDKISAQGHQCIRCGELYTTYDRIFYNSKSCISDEIIQETVLGQKGDVFFAGDGETMLDIGKAVVYNGDEPIYVGGGINILTPNLNKVSSVFISYALNSSYSVSQKSIDGRGDIIVHTRCAFRKK